MATWAGFKKDMVFVIAWGFRLFVNFIAFVGVALISYELIAAHYASHWPVLDVIAIYLSTIFTLVGTIFMALSIYFYSVKPTPPEKISIYVTAPIVTAACLGTLIYFLKVGSIPAHVLNGFALLAIAGALLRIQPHPVKDEMLYWKSTTNTSTGRE
jgi:hypothetical protein